MLDNFNRDINYLRISVTDKCNLRCTYCMPEEGIPLKPHSEILRYEQIELIVKEAAKLGIEKVRLTGGEPLIKKDIEVLIKKIAAIDGIKRLSMTTNAILLENKAKILKQAGLCSVNVSLDTLDADKYKEITRGGDIRKVFFGINAAIEEGISVKLNTVKLKGTNDNEIQDIQDFCHKLNIKFQLINRFSLGASKQDDYYFDRPPKCRNCNRIRLLSDGNLKPCLHSEQEYKTDFENIRESLIKTILSKPENGAVCTSRQMVEIGG